MAKGASIKFKSYSETVPKLLDILNLQSELKKYDKIVLKPCLTNTTENSTAKDFAEAVLKFVLENKNPVAEVFIAEGSDGSETSELFNSLGYDNLSEQYGVSLVDLNNTDTEELENHHFKKFQTIHYPKILWESFIISLPKLALNEEFEFQGAMSNMLGAYPSSHYAGFFSKRKNKIRKWPIKYSVHDIVICKSPNFAVVDGSNKGVILAGLPLEIDKQSARLLGKEWKDVSHLKLIDESMDIKARISNEENLSKEA